MGIVKNIKSAEKRPRGRPPKNTRIVTITKNMEFLKRVDPLNLDGNVSENWRIFKQNFTYFYTAAELNKKSDEIQAAIFLNAVGPEAIELFNSFSLTDEQRKSYKEVIKAFESFCQPKRNEAYSSYKFHSRNQSPSEPFDNFLMDVKKLIKECNFGEQESRMLRDRIVLGVADKNLQKRLLETEDLDEKKAINMARSTETSRQQASQIQSQKYDGKFEINTVSRNMDTFSLGSKSRNSLTNVSRNSNKYNNNDNTSKQNSNHFRQSPNNNKIVNKPCKYCLTSHQKGKCPAWNKICHNCGKRNHFSSACLKKKVCEITETLDCVFIDTVSISSFESNKAWFKKARINNLFVDFKLDTGAEINVIPFSIFRRIKGAKLVDTVAILEVYGGSNK